MTFLDNRAAQRLLEERVGIPISHVVLHHAAMHGKIATQKQPIDPKKERSFFGNTERVYFSSEDVERFARSVNQEKRNLLTVQQAYTLFNAAYPEGSLTFEEFTTLIKRHNIPPVAARLLQNNFFDKESVEEAARTMTPERLQQLLQDNDSLLTAREALHYIKKTRGVALNESTLFRKIQRGTLVPAITPPQNFREGYRFSKESLDAMKLQPWKHIPEERPIRKISSVKELEAFQREYGDNLLSSQEAARIVREKAGREYVLTHILRKLRIHVQPVARFGRSLLYAERDVRTLVVKPLQGAKRTEKE